MPEPSSQPGFSGVNRIFLILALVADAAAIVAVAASGASTIIAVLGVAALVLGVYLLVVRWGRPLDWRATLALMTVLAGTVALTVTVTRAAVIDGRAGAAPGPRESAAPGQGQGLIDGSESPAPESVSPAPEPPSSLSLVNAEAIVSDRELKAGPLKINGKQYERVKWLRWCDPVSDTYQLDRRYRVFRTQVGLGDESPSDSLVKFSVITDGTARHVVTVGVGETKPIEIDVTGAFRIRLLAEPDDCAVVAWIDPVVTA